MEGWISIHRQIMDHWIYRESKPFSKREAWFDLILLANHCDTTFPLGNEIIEAKRGEVITSEVKLMERWKWSKTKLRSFLVLLENDQMIVKKTDRKKTTIILVNYGNFQDSQTIEKPIKDREETAKEPQKDTINNVNNVNNSIINNPISSRSMSGDNPFALFETHKFGKLDHLSRDFIGYTIDIYTENWVIRAIKETVKSNKIAWKYVEGILARWKATGHEEPWTLEKEQPTPNGNVSRFPYQKSQKQPIPIIQTDASQTTALTPEEFEAMKKRAAKLDEKFNKQVPS